MNKHAVCITQAIMILSLLGCGSNVHETGKRIPLENFFKEPEKSSFQMSPDGGRYAYLASRQGQGTLFVVDISRNMTFGPPAAVAGGVDKYLWVDSRTIIFQKAGANGDPHLVIVDLDAKKERGIEGEIKRELKLADNAAVVNGKIMINIRGGSQEPWKLQRLDCRNGSLTPVDENLENVEARVADHECQYRLAAQEEGTETHILFRDSESEPFRRLFHFDNVRDMFRPQLFAPDNKTFYAYSNINRDKAALVEYDPHANAEVKVIYEDPEYDLFGDDEADFIAYSGRQNKLAYIFYTTWRRSYRFLDDHYEDMISRLRQKFPGYEIRVISSDRNEARHIIKISSDRLSGKYYVFDSAGHSLAFIEDAYPWLAEGELAYKKPVQYQARDGFIIHGYLTLPKDVEPKTLPLVVCPHGGPLWRDCWEMGRFGEIQFLANRGYAVLNMNFRGSAGYGKTFMAAGFKQNGLDIQNDISDGIDYLVKQDIVDPKRVAIMGGSYGGYVVLAGLAFTPETYACGVDLFGVSNFFTFLNSLPPWFSKESLYQTIGHPQRDRDLLERTSPLFHADKIKVPLLVAQGGRDPIVNRAESDQMVDALRRRGVPVEYILKENEGHGYFRNEESRLELWWAIEKFLAKHIGDGEIAALDDGKKARRD